MKYKRKVITIMQDVNKKFNVGDTVWYVCCGWAEQASIVEIKDDLAKCKAKIGTCWQPISALHKTEQECKYSMKEKSERIKDQYRKEINSVEDLIVFMFNHHVSSCEYCDDEARAVAKEKALALTNISPSILE